MGITTIVLPARRASTRLPDKLLLRATGKPLLAHSIDRALQVGLDSDRVCVVADDPDLVAVAQACAVRAILTGPCDSGTERIVSALAALPPANVILNLQADEPEMPIAWMRACLAALQSDPTADVVTIAVPTRIGDPALENPNVVKVVLSHDSYALYFSRALIPALRHGGRPPEPRALRHVGLYAYTAGFLNRYAQFPSSDLEQCECLEQLRFLQAGARIKVLVQSEGDHHDRGIDTEEDYQRFVDRWKHGHR